MKGVIPTPGIDQIFYSTLGTEGKNWSTLTFKIYPDTRHSILKGQEKAHTESRYLTQGFTKCDGPMLYNMKMVKNEKSCRFVRLTLKPIAILHHIA